MASIDSLSPVVLGSRLRAARSSAGRTQEEAATHLGFARPTLVAIEKGDRRVRIDELVTLAELYNTSCGALLHEERAIPEFVPQFRMTMGTEADRSDANAAVRLLERLAGAYADLMRLVGVEEDVAYPSPVRLIRGQVLEQAEDAALSVRSVLGLGLSPIPDLPATLESEWAFRIFVRPIQSRISGVYAYTRAMGPCVLLNAKHPPARRQLSAAHELGHFISTREGVEVAIFDSGMDDGLGERFANRFGPAFLMPAPALRRRYNDVIAAGNFSPRHLIFLAHSFHVSIEAMCRRLEALRLIPSGTWDMLVRRGFGAEHVREAAGSAQIGAWAMPHTTRLDMLVAEAYERGLVSEGQLASMLDMDRVDVRELLDRIGADDGEGLDGL